MTVSITQYLTFLANCKACVNITVDHTADDKQETLLKAPGSEQPKPEHTCKRPMNEAEALMKAGSCCPNMTPFVLMIALSVHSIFEGLAVGFAKTLNDVFTLLLAIAVHKGAASSALGISLVKTFPDDFTLCRWLVFTFSLSTPIGIITGMILSGGSVMDVIFNSLAAGSFVYIACSEVIVEEFTIPGNRWWKLLAYLIGIMIIFSLWFIE
jgi:zinc transporter ZupT